MLRYTYTVTPSTNIFYVSGILQFLSISEWLTDNPIENAWYNSLDHYFYFSNKKLMYFYMGKDLLTFDDGNR